MRPGTLWAHARKEFDGSLNSSNGQLESLIAQGIDSRLSQYLYKIGGMDMPES